MRRAVDFETEPGKPGAVVSISSLQWSVEKSAEIVFQRTYRAGLRRLGPVVAKERAERARAQYLEIRAAHAPKEIQK